MGAAAGRGGEFRGATALTPNEEEAAEASGLPVRSAAEASAAGQDLIRRTGAANVLVTRGNQGLVLCSAAAPPAQVPASGSGDEDEVTDANGAGDTVAATLVLALACGASAVDAARLANHAGGVVVLKPGAATLVPAELRAQFRRYGNGRR